jgi:predicted site-specific integrase-resolvase
MDEVYHSTFYVAQQFQVTTETVRNWIKSGVLKKCVQINGMWRVPHSELERLATERHG